MDLRDRRKTMMPKCTSSVVTSDFTNNPPLRMWMGKVNELIDGVTITSLCVC